MVKLLIQSFLKTIATLLLVISGVAVVFTLSPLNPTVKKISPHLASSNSNSKLVQLYLGYADTDHTNSQGPPSPWETTSCSNSANSNNSSCSSVPFHNHNVYADANFFVGSSSDPYDNGALMFLNSSSSTETVSNVKVTIGSFSYSFNNTDYLAPDQGVMLDAAPTSSSSPYCSGILFDTSDTPPCGANPCNVSDKLVPQVEFNLTIGTNSGSITEDDTGEILNTGGFDQANCPQSSETEAWTPIGLPRRLGPLGNVVPTSMTYGMCNANVNAAGNLQDPTSQEINTENGNLIVKYNGFSVPAMGSSLGFNLTYNSLVAQSEASAGSSGSSGPFGWGWTSSNMSSLAISEQYTPSTSSSEGTTVTATCGGGAEAKFIAATSTGSCPSSSLPSGYVPDSNPTDLTATFCAYPMVTSTLSYYANCQCYVLGQNSNNKVLTYSSSGELTNIGTPEDPDLVNIAYNVSPGTSYCPSTTAYNSAYSNWLSYCTVYTDASGLQIAIGYNEYEMIDGIWNTNGNAPTDEWQFSYNGTIGIPLSSNLLELTSITDPLGNVTNYTYDSSNSNSNYDNDIISQTPPLGASNLTCGTKSTPTYTTCYTYNSNGQVSTVTDPLGNATSYAYNVDLSTGDGSTIITDPNNNETEDNYEYGELTSVVTGYDTATSASTHYFYDPYTLMTIATVYPNGTTVTNDYDSRGNLCWSANGNFINLVIAFVEQSCSSDLATPPSGATVYTYNRYGEPIATTDPRGFTTYNGYDRYGNLLGNLQGISSNNVSSNITSLGAVGCASPTNSTPPVVTCLVGESNGSNNNGVLFETQNNGTTFSEVPGPLTTGSNAVTAGLGKITSISCVSSSECFATSTSSADNIFDTSSGYNIQPNGPVLIQISDSSGSWTWSPVIQANSSVSGQQNISQLNSVSCVSGACYAVGLSNSGTGVVLYSGSSWAEQTLPSGVTDLNSISCSSSSNCVAVGIGGTSGTDPIDVFTTNTGSNWTLQDQSAISQLATFTSISCPTTLVCVVGGTDSSGNSDIIGLNWSSTNSNWAGTSYISYIPLITSELAVNSISCSSTTQCVAVGNLVNGGTYSLYSTNGLSSSWSIGCSNNTGGCSSSISAPMNTLTDISCSTSTTCIAVGGSIAGTAEFLNTTDGLTYSTTLPISSYTSNTYYNSSNGGCYPIAGSSNCSANIYGELASSTDQNSNTTTYSYDGQGNVVSTTDPMGNVSTFSYDNLGNITQSVKPLGNVSGAVIQNYTTYSAYNADGMICWTATNEPSTYTYVDSCSSPPSNATVYTYDLDNNLVLTQEPSNGSTTPYVTTAYNGNDQVCWTITSSTNFSSNSCSSPPTGATVFQYDSIGNRISETGPNSNTSNWTYTDPNCPNSPTTRTLPEYTTNNYDVYEYNSSCQLVATVNPLGYVSTSGYDSAGNLVGQFPNDPGGVVNLNAIDCYSTTSCIAGGTGVAGYSTTMLNTTNAGVYINGVSYTSTVATSIDSIACPSSTVCFATGVDANNNPAIFESSDSGDTWSEQTLPTGINSLNSISCSSTTNCVAVGSGSSIFDPVDVFTTNGTSWTLQDQSSVSQLGSLTSVDCLTSTTCIAAGGDTSGNADIVELNWSSTSNNWAATSLVSSINNINYLNPISSISCTSATNCVAVGTLNNTGAYVLYSSNVGTTSFDSYCNNTTDVCNYSLPKSFQTLNSVSCVSATDCYGTGTANVSTGTSFYTSSVPSVLSMDLSTPSFSVQSIPVNTDPETKNADISVNNQIDSISCLSATTCYIGGESDASAAAIYETTNSGSTWNLVSGLTPETFSYNPDSMQTEANDYSGTTTTTYNNFGEITSVTDGSGSTVGYSYDNNGNITCVAYPNSNGTSNCNSPASSSNTIVNYTYNKDNLMTSVSDWLSNDTQFAYNADNQVSSINYPSSTTFNLSLTYDPTGALTNEVVDNNGTNSNIATSRNTNESIASTQTNSGNIQSTSYNGANQVTSAGSQATSGTDSYYNYSIAGGNLNCITQPNSSGYNCSNMNSNSSNSLVYGSNGGVNGGELACSVPSSSILSTCPTTPVTNETTYGYSNAGQRTSQSTVTSTSTNTTYYSYGASGNLNCITLPNTSGYNCSNQNPQYTNTFVYNSSNEIMAETLANSSTQVFTWNNNSSVPRIIDDSLNYYIYGPSVFNYGPIPIEQINQSTGDVYYLVDTYAGVTATYNSSFSGVELQIYSPYGIDQTGGQDITPLCYQAGYQFPNNLVYFINRVYDPTTGEFLTIDPMFDSTYQAYGYVGGDPVNGSDVNGLGAQLANPQCQQGSNCPVVATTASPLCQSGGMFACGLATPPSIGCYNLESYMEDQLNNPSQSLSVDEAKAAAANQGMGCDIASDSNLTQYYGNSWVPNSFLANSGNIIGSAAYCAALGAVDGGTTSVPQGLACALIVGFLSYGSYVILKQSKLQQAKSDNQILQEYNRLMNNYNC